MIERVIAHRGASGYAPENTFAAFDKAVALGARMVEFDVMLSQDCEPFVIHDENLKRTTNGRGLMFEVDEKYIRTLDAGRWFSRKFAQEKIPHLKEVLQWLLFTGTSANIEIKPCMGMEEATALKVVELIHRYWPVQRPLPLVSSFDWAALDVCRSLVPEIPIGMLLHDWREDWQASAKTLQAFSIHVNRKIITKDRVEKIKQQGYKLAVYTVNRYRQARRLFELGADAIFTDYPDIYPCDVV